MSAVAKKSEAHFWMLPCEIKKPLFQKLARLSSSKCGCPAVQDRCNSSNLEGQGLANSQFPPTRSPVSILEGNCTSSPNNGAVASNLQSSFTPVFYVRFEASVVMFVLSGGPESQMADTRQHLQAHSIVLTVQLRSS